MFCSQLQQPVVLPYVQTFHILHKFTYFVTKTFFDIKSKLFQELLEKQQKLFNVWISGNWSPDAVKLFVKVWRVILVKHPSKGNVRVARDFYRNISHIYKKSGPVFLVKYLKGCSVLLQQSAGGQRTPSTQALGAAISRTKAGGIPRIIPRLHRLEIRKGNAQIIQFWLSVFNVYRVVTIPCKAKLETITKGSGSMDPTILPVLARFLPIFWTMLSKYQSWVIAFANGSITGFTTSQCSAYLTEKSTSVLEGGLGDMYKGSSYLGILESVWAWRTIMSRLKKEESLRARNLVNGFVTWIKEVTPWMVKFFLSEGDLTVPSTGLEVWENISKWGYSLSAKWGAGTHWRSLRDTGAHYSMGRLVGLEEPAGKLRIIAMVDMLTQWALKPLHNLIFRILEFIPQDGTFDQDAPLLLLRKTMKKLDHKWIASYDLSAATDCLPVKFQQLIIASLIGEKLATSWKNILVARSYSYKGKPLYYGVGQPMGALSSWASLAITHHIIVQLAAWLVQPRGIPRWFKMYAVLGDDVVIADPLVARQYLLLMDRLGVKVGLAKSLVSPKGYFEFAKRYYSPAANMSPISIRELLVGAVNFNVLRTTVTKWNGELPTLLALMGYKHGILGSLDAHWSKLPKRARTAIITFLGPSSKDFNLSTWLRSRSRVVANKNLNPQALPIYIWRIILVAFASVNKFTLSEMQWAGKGWKEAQVSMKLQSDDPRLFGVIQNSVMIPLLKDQKAKARSLRIKLHAMKTLVLVNFDNKDLQFWEPVLMEVLEIRKQAFDLRTPFYEQSPTPVKHAPDARADVKLWNNLSVVGPLPVPADIKKNLANAIHMDILRKEYAESLLPKSLDKTPVVDANPSASTLPWEPAPVRPSSAATRTRLLKEWKSFLKK